MDENFVQNYTATFQFQTLRDTLFFSEPLISAPRSGYVELQLKKLMVSKGFAETQSDTRFFFEFLSKPVD